MKNQVRWDNLSWPEIEELSENEAIVIIPTGSTEQHGPHLPVGCDSILATAMAEKAAAEINSRGKKCVVAPTITVANSVHHMSFYGSMTLHPDTFTHVLTEYCRCIASHGFEKIVIMNGHGGNKSPIDVALITINEELGFPVYHMGYWNGSEKVLAENIKTQNGGIIHACEGETSLMLAINEDLVLPIYKETSGNMSKGFKPESDGLVSTFHRMEYTTENGVMGNSYAATKEKGINMVEKMTQNLADILCNDELWGREV